MNINKSNIANFALIIFGVSTGLFFVNCLLFLLFRGVDQRNGFPRQMLYYLPPIMRWSYPDIYKDIRDDRIILIGDSYTEGAGDSYLNNEYKYSFAHTLKDKTSYSYALAANGGSTIPKQISLLISRFNGKYGPSINRFPEELYGSNIIYAFYEGNDLDDFIDLEIRKQLDQAQETYTSQRSRFFPLYGILRMIYGLNIRPYFINNSLKKNKKILKITSPTKKGELEELKLNNGELNQNIICFANNKCIRLPVIEAASPDLNDQQIKTGVRHNIEKIKSLQEEYNTKSCLVYIPSPGTIYSPETISYKQNNHKLNRLNGVVTGQANIKRSLSIRESLKTGLAQHKINFLDPTIELSDLAKKKYIHGLKDHTHFNSLGYQTLGSYIANNIKKCFPGLAKN